MVWKEFWLEAVMVKCSGNEMEFGFGVKKKDAAQSTRHVRGQGVCGLGVLWAWWADGFPEVSKPRLLDHAHGDAHTEG